MKPDTYDIIYLAPDEWNNEVMREVAEVYFAAHPDVEFVYVHEHGGWHLGYRRDLSIWATANDTAVLKPGPRPAKWSGVDIRRERKAPIVALRLAEEAVA